MWAFLSTPSLLVSVARQGLRDGFKLNEDDGDVHLFVYHFALAAASAMVSSFSACFFHSFRLCLSLRS